MSVSWLTKISQNWGIDHLPKMIELAFDLDPIAESHSKGKLIKTRENIKPAQAQSIFLCLQEYVDKERSFTASIVLSVKNQYIQANIIVINNYDERIDTSLVVNSNNIKQMPHQIVVNTYKLIDIMFQQDEEDDNEDDGDSDNGPDYDPVSPSPNSILQPSFAKRISWFTKLASPKAVPLPSGTSPSNSGGEKVDANMSKTQVRQEEKRFPGLKYLGEGSAGIAFFTDEDKVVKYTTDPSEFAIAVHAKNNPCPCIAKIYDVKDITQYKAKPLYAIQLEKLKLLPRYLQSVVSNATSVLSADLAMAALPDNKIQQKIRSVLLNDFNIREEDQGFVDNVVEFLLCLLKNGYKFDDIHGGNVGTDIMGTLKLFDLGYSR